MIASPIDPTDQTSEVDDPAYRASFWDSPGACDEWELAEADLDEVLEWVRDHSDGRPHSLWVVVRRGPGVELIRLRGIDPPSDPSTWPGLGHGSEGVTSASLDSGRLAATARGAVPGVGL